MLRRSLQHPKVNRLDDPLAGLGNAGELGTGCPSRFAGNEHGLVLYSTDGDFGRFRNLRWQNPLLA